MNLVDELRHRTLVADGAMGTQLQLAGLPIGHGSERWCLERADAVEAIHRAYLAAGSDLVITNSFGAHAWGLGPAGLADRLEAINRESVRIARRAAGPHRGVLGDVGPSGQLLEPLGPLTLERLRADLVRRVSALLDAGVDGIVCETMTDLEEAAAFVEVAVGAGARLREAGAAIVGGCCGTIPAHIDALRRIVAN